MCPAGWGMDEGSVQVTRAGDMDVETLRMGERIIIALGGILSIILGYKLFFVASIKTDSGADFKSSLFNASFTKVGPGVFFALFGAYVMSMSVKTQINIETHQGNQPTVNQTAPNQAGILSQMSTA